MDVGTGADECSCFLLWQLPPYHSSDRFRLRGGSVFIWLELSSVSAIECFAWSFVTPPCATLLLITSDVTCSKVRKLFSKSIDHWLCSFLTLTWSQIEPLYCLYDDNKTNRMIVYPQPFCVTRLFFFFFCIIASPGQSQWRTVWLVTTATTWEDGRGLRGDHLCLGGGFR